MDDYITYLKENLNLNGFILLRINSEKILVFKSFIKYSKCIYISFYEDYIEVKIDKVFDSTHYYPGIERLIVSKRLFENKDETLNYIQKNIAIKKVI